ncbi:GntR family transcriptional regulator [Herbiconiux sp. KACC 21604]|uniref:GntR family transcriptional regulator n=1 Tax=unclassified Herbiconiux TaxID=2618217 RepID=UPI001492A47C|nr:GntR family transcriptional regulator [Herbiconiux sp. SALV-R1]QJU55123.1 GntR family transcriptional regulator [Herbiconiux sp. SALV-R1]WPO86272.1 GntR family transcriptional regulator [Herbiconiux sp. KACC 21604]
MINKLPDDVSSAAARMLGTAPGGLAVPNRRDQILDVLRAAVLSGAMEDGVVYSAPALSAQFGVSPTPVREAMITLAREKLITVAPNKGFVVASPTQRELTEMLDARLLLEVPMARRVAQDGLSDDDYARLGELADHTLTTAQKGDFIAHVLADLTFHVELVGLGGNAEITEIVRTLRARWRLSGLDSPAKHDVLIHTSEQHRELVELIRAKDADAAATLLDEHLRLAGDAWREEAAAQE